MGGIIPLASGAAARAGGAGEYHITKILWHKDRHKRIVVSTMSPQHPESTHSQEWGDEELVKVLGIGYEMLLFDARRNLADLVLPALRWAPDGGLSLRPAPPAADGAVPAGYTQMAADAGLISQEAADAAKAAAATTATGKDSQVRSAQAATK